MFRRMPTTIAVAEKNTRTSRDTHFVSFPTHTFAQNGADTVVRHTSVAYELYGKITHSGWRYICSSPCGCLSLNSKTVRRKFPPTEMRLRVFIRVYSNSLLTPLPMHELSKYACVHVHTFCIDGKDPGARFLPSSPSLAIVLHNCQRLRIMHRNEALCEPDSFDHIPLHTLLL